MGYSFVWKAGAEPILYMPSSKVVPLRVVQNIPYLDAGDGASFPREPRRMECLPIAAVVGGVNIALPGVGADDEDDEEIDAAADPDGDEVEPREDGDLPPDDGGQPAVTDVPGGHERAKEGEA